MVRVYHWKHGWIPLTHTAALAKAHGSEKGAARILGKLHPVAHDHLPRQAHITAGHTGNGHFAILDSHTGHSTRITDQQASDLHGSGRTITGVKADGRLVTTLPKVPTAWQKISAEDALGPLERDPRTNLPMSPLARGKALVSVSQAFRSANGHTVTIEPHMTQAQTQEFLDSVDAVLGRAGVGTTPASVRVHVPSGDRQFRSGRTLAYVRRGESTIYVSPKAAAGFEYQKGTDHFMPAHEATSTLRYTLAHELGHLIDHEHNHIGGKRGNAMPRFTAGGQEAPKSTEKALFTEFRSQMSKYGATTATEAYAEAYAQWHSGQHNTIADAYAARYGWTR